jgi:glutaredoxin
LFRAVIIYTQETCPPCHEEKLWLKENGIEFEERDIRKEPKYLSELIDLGASATPLTVYRDENDETVVFGFDREKFAEFVASK